MQNNLNQLYFSQMALNTYRKCPRCFRFRYLDALYWPRDWDEKDRKGLARGKLFHRLAQRYYDCGSKPALETLEPELKVWFERLQDFCPRVEAGKFLPEYELRLNKGGLKLVAKFDLVYLGEEEDEIIIYDWKTGERQLDKSILRDNYQTAVYLFVLCSAAGNYSGIGEISPGNVSLVYWNPRFPGIDCRINYSIPRFNRDQRRLTRKIKEIKSLSREEFEPVNKPEVCSRCTYSSLCK